MSGRQWRPGVCGVRPVLACVFAAFLVYPGAVEAQRVDSALSPPLPDERPVAERKLKRDYSVDSVGLQIVLPAFDLDAQKSAENGNGSRRLEIGVHRQLAGSIPGRPVFSARLGGTGRRLYCCRPVGDLAGSIGDADGNSGAVAARRRNPFLRRAGESGAGCFQLSGDSSGRFPREGREL